MGTGSMTQSKRERVNAAVDRVSGQVMERVQKLPVPDGIASCHAHLAMHIAPLFYSVPAG